LTISERLLTFLGGRLVTHRKLKLLIINKSEKMEKLDNMHPGEVLKEEFMKPLYITAYRLSNDLGIPHNSG
jgi:hypothetical protein